MGWVIENWFMLISTGAILAVLAIMIQDFVGLPKASQVSKIKEWLLWACVEAERELGGGTGQLKLRYVYNMFVARFPAVDKLISFETFSGWVDEALEKMKSLLDSNKEVGYFVAGKDW